MAVIVRAERAVPRRGPRSLRQQRILVRVVGGGHLHGRRHLCADVVRVQLRVLLLRRARVVHGQILHVGPAEGLRQQPQQQLQRVGTARHPRRVNAAAGGEAHAHGLHGRAGDEGAALEGQQRLTVGGGALGEDGDLRPLGAVAPPLEAPHQLPAARTVRAQDGHGLQRLADDADHRQREVLYGAHRRREEGEDEEDGLYEAHVVAHHHRRLLRPRGPPLDSDPYVAQHEQQPAAVPPQRIQRRAPPRSQRLALDVLQAHARDDGAAVRVGHEEECEQRRCSEGEHEGH